MKKFAEDDGYFRASTNKCSMLWEVAVTERSHFLELCMCGIFHVEYSSTISYLLWSLDVDYAVL
jgi:hypothetical protein